MSVSEHTNFLRSLPNVYNLNRPTVQAIFDAADYIEELEGQVKLLQRIGNLDSSPGLVERIASLESRMTAIATSMDLENLAMQLRNEFSRFVVRR